MVDIFVQTIDKDKIIACAVHLREFQLHNLHKGVRRTLLHLFQ
jgi:hypothetical protein